MEGQAPHFIDSLSHARAASLVVRPHAEHLHDFFARQNLVDQAVMDVDPARIGTGEIADELLETRRRLEGIAFENFEKRLGLRLQARAAQFLCVFCCLWRIDDAPRAHQSSDFRHSRTEVFNPFRIEARIPGIERRWSVSWMACQSFIESSTASARFPVICTGSLVTAASSMSL